MWRWVRWTHRTPHWVRWTHRTPHWVRWTHRTPHWVRWTHRTPHWVRWTHRTPHWVRWTHRTPHWGAWGACQARVPSTWRPSSVGQAVTGSFGPLPHVHSSRTIGPGPSAEAASAGVSFAK